MTLAVLPRVDQRVTRPDDILRPETIRERLRLDIGGAASPYAPDEYTTVDLFGDPDVRADMADLPFADGSVDAIWASHVLEHCAMTKVPDVLREWLRVLRPHGRAIIRVPNFDYVARYWLTGPDRAWAEAMVFGHQANEGEFHKAAFTAAMIRGDLEGVGFECLRVEMRWTHNQETLQAVARKPALAVVE
jgi:predicted SAM-dependent methyltransferase